MNCDMWISQKEGNIIKASKLFKIPDPDPHNEKEKQRALKSLKLNGFSTLSYDPAFDPMLKAASSPSIKPTIRIKRLSFSSSSSSNAKGIKLRGASLLRKKLNDDKEKAEKALKLNSLFS